MSRWGDFKVVHVPLLTLGPTSCGFLGITCSLELLHPAVLSALPQVLRAWQQPGQGRPLVIQTGVVAHQQPGHSGQQFILASLCGKVVATINHHQLWEYLLYRSCCETIEIH